MGENTRRNVEKYWKEMQENTEEIQENRKERKNRIQMVYLLFK